MKVENLRFQVVTIKEPIGMSFVEGVNEAEEHQESERW